MKSRRRLSIPLLSGLFVTLLVAAQATPAGALKWRVESFNYSRVAPNPYPQGRVIGNALHKLRITEWDLVDEVFPITLELTKGSIMMNLGVMQTCSSGKLYFRGGETTSASCFTRIEIEPCYWGEGVWESEATGVVENHPSGGSKVGVGVPLVLFCPC